MSDLQPFSDQDLATNWGGQIPPSWTATRLRFAADVSNSNVDKKEYDGQETVRLCNYTDVYYNERITPDLEFMKATASREEIKKFGLKRDDVIITKDSEDPLDIGIPAIVEEDMPGIVCGYHLSVIRSFKDVHANFLRYSLTSAINKALMYVRTPGITRFGLNQDTIKNVFVALPPLEEQTAIAGYLERETARIDGLIEKKTRFIALLKEKQLAFSDTCVTGADVKARRMKPSGILWAPFVPEGWSVKRGKDVFQEMARPVQPGDEIITSFRDGQVCLRSKRRTDGYTFAEKEVGYQRILKGDLVIHTMDAFAGAIGISEDDGKATGEYAVCTPHHPEETNSTYFALLLRCMARRNYIYVLCPSVRERAPRFRFVRFAPVALPVPPRAEQDEIVARIQSNAERTKDLITKTDRSIALLREKRAALITAAVTGKIDVRHMA